MRVIVTKYATTSGIKVREGEISNPETMFQCNDKGTGAYREYFHGNDWHRSADDAVLDVEKRFSRKRKSLQKKLSDLDSKFNAAINAIHESGL